MNPHKTKYFPMYMDMAVRVSQESYAKRKQVGSVLVQPDGLIAIGFNGRAAGEPNVCELPDGTTDPRTIHAEVNSINKLNQSGSIAFTTLSPCINCAKALVAGGVTTVYYRDFHRKDGLDYLFSRGVKAVEWSELKE